MLEDIDHGALDVVLRTTLNLCSNKKEMPSMHMLDKVIIGGSFECIPPFLQIEFRGSKCEFPNGEVCDYAALIKGGMCGQMALRIVAVRHGAQRERYAIRAPISSAWLC